MRNKAARILAKPLKQLAKNYHDAFMCLTTTYTVIYSTCMYGTFDIIINYEKYKCTYINLIYT